MIAPLETSIESARPLAVARWLWAIIVLLVCIVVVGGITRLTESGVSITQWKPISGVLPPLSAAHWQAEFDAYRQTPQYIQVNGPAGMTLATYKAIFFWEWLHRLLARFLVGIAFTVPLAVFWVKGMIPQGYKSRLALLLALGGLQGVIGWWMVVSGITNDVKVSHLRLVVHLLLALFILAAALWTALDLQAQARREAKSRLTRLGALALAMLFVQLGLGAMVAGLRAGHIANDWPLMMGRIVPDGIDWSGGALQALLHDPFLIHFLHRWWAWAIVIILVIVARRLRRDARHLSVLLHTALGTQIVLGIATVLSGPTIWVAVLHQLVGALLVAVTAAAAHALGRPA